jgi:amphi-Trp domain-containing protein
MGSARKEKLSLSRADAVQRLQRLARELDEGALHFRHEAFAVPDQVRLSIKAERGEFEIELKWEAPAVADRGDEEVTNPIEEPAPPR